jgi:hypothetical protein
VKRLTSVVAVLLLIAALPLFAAERRLVDDVIRMSRAGVSEDSIIAFVQNTRGSVDVSADDIIAMTEAGLSKPLIKAVMDEATARKGNHREAEYAPAPRSYYPPPYYYDPYYYYDPFWYGPRVFIGFGGGFHGGGFHGGGHRGHR